MEGRSERVGRYGAEVVGWLRRWLIEEGRQTLLGSWSYSIRTEDVALEKRGEDWMAVIRFQIVGDVRRYGFTVIAADAADLQHATPDLTAETIVILLDEAVLTRGRIPKPDEEGIVWLQ